MYPITCTYVCIYYKLVYSTYITIFTKLRHSQISFIWTMNSFQFTTNFLSLTYDFIPGSSFGILTIKFQGFILFQHNWYILLSNHLWICEAFKILHSYVTILTFLLTRKHIFDWKQLAYKFIATLFNFQTSLINLSRWIWHFGIVYVTISIMYGSCFMF